MSDDKSISLVNLVSAYFDLAELNAIEEREMRMADYVRELDNILSSAGRKLLNNAGSISHSAAENKAKLEYQKYKAKTLAAVEKDYLKVTTSYARGLNRDSKGVSPLKSLYFAQQS